MSPFVEEPLAQLSERIKQIILESNANFKANVHLNETALDNINQFKTLKDSFQKLSGELPDARWKATLTEAASKSRVT